MCYTITTVFYKFLDDAEASKYFPEIAEKEYYSESPLRFVSEYGLICTVKADHMFSFDGLGNITYEM